MTNYLIGNKVIIEIALGILLFYVIIFGAAIIMGIILGMLNLIYELICGMRYLILKALKLEDSI